ncbi:MAG: sulfotransferase, partial [Acidothermales bacterium]|nr:sulfotransferase [Acidothermales bacterium]
MEAVIGTHRDRPIFILGCPRSGTTLLQLMLHAHPRIAIPPENRFVLPVYTGRDQFGDLREAENRRKVAAAIIGTKKQSTQFRDFRLKPDDVVELVVAAPPTVGSALAAVFRAYAERFGKPRWGDKRPAYHHYLPFVRQMFPDAQFIQVVRDGRACVASLKRMPWWEYGTYGAVAEWAMAFDNCRRYARGLPSDTFHQIRYEDLVADPHGELSKLCVFLGEEFDDAMTTPKEVAQIAVPKFKKWHTQTHADLSDESVARWQQELEPWEIQLCETVLGRRLRAYGYELTGTGRAPASHLAAYARTMYSRRQAVARRKIRDRLTRLRHPA